MSREWLQLSEEVAAALAQGQPVVALESTVIAHGLPHPVNVETALAMEAAVREAGAVPATVGVVGGQVMVGLDEPLIRQFGETAHADERRDDKPPNKQKVVKLGARDLSAAVALGLDGATTVGATMRVAALAGIEVMATGGIGGVHHGAVQSWDISGDLAALAQYPVLVVCGGAKAIVDIPATLEWLETHGVPVVGWQCAEFPAFYTARSGCRLGVTFECLDELTHMWQVERMWGGHGVVVAQPPPEEVPGVEVAIAAALSRAKALGLRGAAVTPYLLAQVSELTGGRSLEVNVKLLKHNAKTAAKIAFSLASKKRKS
ncbi:MAG: pseudouridine-5'-phosphate glycosidase [Acidobacteriota bacterium]